MRTHLHFSHTCLMYKQYTSKYELSRQKSNHSTQVTNKKSIQDELAKMEYHSSLSKTQLTLLKYIKTSTGIKGKKSSEVVSIQRLKMKPRDIRSPKKQKENKNDENKIKNITHKNLI